MAMRPSPEYAAAPPAPGALHPERDTFPKLVRHNAERLPRKVAIREKDLGIWQSYTWRDYLERSRLIALGLASLGFARGDKVAIVGDNRPQLYWAVTATQGLGGVPVPIYQDSIEKEMQYVIDHAEVRFAVVEDQEQVDKLLHVRGQCPRLEFIIYEDPRGMRGYREAFLLSLRDLEERGRAFAGAHPDHFESEMAKGTADEAAIICYTSGTTGAPKGAILSHRNLIVTATNAARAEGLGSDEEILSYLPMGWVGDHIFSYAQSIILGFTANCPESPATVLSDLKEIGPTYFFAPPRIWENVLTSVMIRVEDSARPKRGPRPFLPRSRAGSGTPPAGPGSRTGSPTPGAGCSFPSASSWSTGRCATTSGCGASAAPTPRARPSARRSSSSSAPSAST